MVMLCALALSALAPAPDAKADLQAVFARYKALKSYSATIECQDASGLFPGHYVLSIKWSTGQKFDITVLEPTKPAPTEPGNAVPSFSCDGKTVTRKLADGSESADALNTDPNITPGYEVACSMVMTALLDSPSGKRILSPPPPLKIEFTYGKTEEWKGAKVKEIVLAYEAGGTKGTYSIYLTEDGKWLVGMQYRINGKDAFVRYKDAKYEEG